MPSRADLSNAIFGSRKRLDFLVAVATAGPGELYPDAIGKASGMGSAASTELRKLMNVGLLELAPSDSRKVHYERSSSPLWKLVIALNA